MRYLACDPHPQHRATKVDLQKLKPAFGVRGDGNCLVAKQHLLVHDDVQAPHVGDTGGRTAYDPVRGKFQSSRDLLPIVGGGVNLLAAYDQEIEI